MPIHQLFDFPELNNILLHFVMLSKGVCYKNLISFDFVLPVRVLSFLMSPVQSVVESTTRKLSSTKQQKISGKQ